jgi:hypothetical protein
MVRRARSVRPGDAWKAVNETNIDVFPGACPWSVEQVLDERFLPE